MTIGSAGYICKRVKLWNLHWYDIFAFHSLRIADQFIWITILNENDIDKHFAWRTCDYLVRFNRSSLISRFITPSRDCMLLGWLSAWTKRKGNGVKKEWHALLSFLSISHIFPLSMSFSRSNLAHPLWNWEWWVSPDYCEMYQIIATERPSFYECQHQQTKALLVSDIVQ